MPPSRAVTEPLRVTIDDRNPDGRGRAQHEGRAVLVSQASPGEELLVRIDRVTRGTVQGRVRSLEKADPGRIPHACLHEFFCTGCPFLALPRDEELAFKRTRLEEIVRDLPSVENTVLEAARTPTEVFGHRALAKMVFARRRGRFVLGSYVAGTHQVADMRGCPVLEPALGALLDALRTDLGSRWIPIHGEEGAEGFRYLIARWSLAEQRAQLVFVSSELGLARSAEIAEEVARNHPEVAAAAIIENRSAGNAMLAGPITRLFGDRIEEELLGYRHPIGPKSFFQVNPRAATELFSVARDLAGSGALVFEGYAGAGALTLPLSEGFERVVAVEKQAEAAGVLEATARRYERPGIEVVTGDTGPALERFLAEAGPAPVVLDPPRAGCGEPVVEPLIRYRPPRIVLLSCEPATLGRDLPQLLGAGYSVRRIVPVDQFPRTAHIETVTLLEQ